MAEQTIHEINEQSAPSVIEHFVGQERVKRQVKTALEASWADGTRLPHLLFSGPPGVGKTQLAGILSKELGTELQETLAQNLTNISDVQGFLLQAKHKSVLLIDEIDQLPKLQQVTLYRSLEEGRIFLNSGAKKKTHTIKLEPFCLIGCTNFSEYLLKPLQDRFKINVSFTFYHPDEIETILRHRCKRLGWNIDEIVYSAIASVSRGTPRIGLRLLESAWRTARANGNHHISKDCLFDTLDMEGIDNLSLNDEERKYMSIVEQHGNLVRLNVIATHMGQSNRSISINMEPFLIRSGLLTKDPRNGCRMLTPKGLDHICSCYEKEQ